MTTTARNRYNELTADEQFCMDQYINAIASSGSLPMSPTITYATDAAHERMRRAGFNQHTIR